VRLDLSIGRHGFARLLDYLGLPVRRGNPPRSPQRQRQYCLISRLRAIFLLEREKCIIFRITWSNGALPVAETGSVHDERDTRRSDRGGAYWQNAWL